MPFADDDLKILRYPQPLHDVPVEKKISKKKILRTQSSLATTCNVYLQHDILPINEKAMTKHCLSLT